LGRSAPVHAAVLSAEQGVEGVTNGEADRADVTGVHRARRGLFTVALSLITVGTIISVVHAVSDRQWWNALLWAAICTFWVLAFGGLLRSCTIVDTDGLLIRAAWGPWKRISWDAVASLSSTSGALASPQFITVRTRQGKTVVTRIPSRLRPALDHYITEHRRADGPPSDTRHTR
jgi:hypothetical protein